MFGQRSGYAHFEQKSVDYKGQPAWQVVNDMRSELARFNAGRTESVVMASRSTWIEDERGTRFLESRLNLGGGESLTSVEILDGEARLRTVSPQGREQVRTIPWDQTILAPRAAERATLELLRGDAEMVSYKTFSFEAGNRVLEVRIRRLETLPDGAVVVEQEAVGLGLTTRETYAADGTLLRQEVGPVVMRLATREEALAPVEADLAAFRQLSVGFDRALPQARRLRQATYRLIARGDGAPRLADIFAQDGRQRIEQREGEEVLMVTVPKLSLEDAANPEHQDDPPSDACLQPSGLIESDDAAVQRVARKVVKGASDPLDAAHRLEAWVHENIGFSGAGIGLATARQTLDSRDGDCTENAFLLTALLRATGIPARVVVGLVHSGGDGQFLYHAWTEAYLEDLGMWLALDSAVYGPRVDATHLAMARTTASDEGTLLEMALPLLGNLGRFDLAWATTD